MKHILTLLFVLCMVVTTAAQTRTIHTFVALCDNKNQGIVPVPASLGNGQSPGTNLYWGAAYGLKTYFKNKTPDWQLVQRYDLPDSTGILERILFKHATEDIFLLADAYDGAEIKDCTVDFLRASNGQAALEIDYEDQPLHFGGKADLLAYVGHDGLMEFQVNVDYEASTDNNNEVIILACYSKSYFSKEIKKAGATPLLWTTHLMAPEAYTLKAAIDGWINRESGAQIDERAAQAYHKYQKCGIKGARNLFTTGF